eukprot:Em0012g564a
MQGPKMLLATIVLLMLCAQSQCQVCSNGQTRLVGGANQTLGRVEVCISNTWGTICDDNWSSEDARVVCSQLGYPSGGAQSYSFAAFGKGSGPIWFSDVQCSGAEVSLQKCFKGPVGAAYCSHQEDAGVLCTNRDYLPFISLGTISGVPTLPIPKVDDGYSSPIYVSQSFPFKSASGIQYANTVYNIAVMVNYVLLEDLPQWKAELKCVMGVFPGDVADTSTSAAISWSPTVGCPPIPGTVQVAPWLLQHQSFVLPSTSEEGHLKYPKPSLPAFKDVVIPANAGLLSCKQLLLHPPDQISSESEVQQGDSLGPCCFYCARFGVQPECRKSNDILQACYFDGGQPASCSAYFEEMGLHVYLKSRKGNSSFPSDQHNLDILEAKFITGEGAESRKLLSGLVDIPAPSIVEDSAPMAAYGWWMDPLHMREELRSALEDAGELYVPMAFLTTKPQ